MSWHKWKYKYLTVLLLSLVFAVFLAGNSNFHSFLINLGSMKYIGALFAGIVFVSSFTAATSIVVIGTLAQDIHPITLGLIGGIGAVMGDLLIFRFIKSHLGDELAILCGKDGTSYVRSVIHSKYIGWTLPIIGMAIIASPLPDELGISLLGLSNMSETRFMFISFVSNATGILIIASVARII